MRYIGGLFMGFFISSSGLVLIYKHLSFLYHFTAKKMRDLKVERRRVIKFPNKQGNSAKDILERIVRVCGENSPLYFLRQIMALALKMC